MARIQFPVAGIVLPLCVVVAVFVTVATSARSGVMRAVPQLSEHSLDEADASVTDINRLFARKWAEAGIQPANPADDLTVFRRLSQVLHGTVPSLEEIRVFEADHQPRRIERWVQRMLNDRRFSDYFARRLSRVFVGADEGQFVVFRRDRFWAWLGEQIQKDRPYDEVVRAMIAERGLWTGEPEVNFVTAAVNDGNVDVNKLAGRTVRAFLGQRIDCAQCHNHPFADWKQEQFQGLAACFGKVRLSPVGVEDNRQEPYKVQDPKTLEDREVKPEAPFLTDCFPAEGTERQRLAAWVTAAENRRFERAIANRVWGLMFGRPWIAPVDDLPDPSAQGRQPDDLLDIVGADFRQHQCNLKRMIAVIAASHPFRLSSEHPEFDSLDRTAVIEETWAAFPISRLRPEQVIGAMLQASSVKTIDQNSHWVRRAFRFFQELNFVNEYGDLGDDELREHSGTIPQALLRMNGEFARDRSVGNPFTAPGRIAGMAPTAESCLDLCFLVCLTRYPTPDERSQLLPRFQNKRKDKRKNKRKDDRKVNRKVNRKEAVEDVFWTLYNSAEFNWGH